MQTRRRVMVTGASGFVGSQAVALLAARGDEVHAVGRRVFTSAHDRVYWHHADLLDTSAITALVARVRPTDLLHFAWNVEHGVYWHSPDNLRWVEAGLALVRNFREAGGRRCVVAGTCAEYAWGRDDGLLDEYSSPREPATFYGVTKEALRRVIDGYAAATGLSSAWGEIFSPYGPGEHAARLVPSVICRLLRGEEAPTSHGLQERDFLYVSDLASAFVAIMDSEVQGSVNIGSGERTTIADVVRLAGEIVGRPELLRIGALPIHLNDAPVIRPVLERLHQEVGWRPSITLRDGMALTVRWWRARLAADASPPGIPE